LHKVVSILILVISISFKFEIIPEILASSSVFRSFFQRHYLTILQLVDGRGHMPPDLSVVSRHFPLIPESLHIHRSAFLQKDKNIEEIY